jgi:stage IV sporulation protein FA
MSFDRFKEGVRKRRHERLQLLRKKQRNLTTTSFGSSKPSAEYPTMYSDFFTSSEPEETPDKPTGVYSLLLRVVCSLLLIAGVYMVMKSDHPQFTSTQGFISDVMQREYNVKGVMNWYEETVGDQPSFLPAIIRGNELDEPRRVEDYVVPVSGGTVVSNFGQDRQGIMVGTTTTLPIEVVKEGRVIYVGEKEGLGLTVVIDHGHGEESWYGQIQKHQVQLYEWVQQGDVIGSTSVSSVNGKGIFYFALRKNANFINPLDVIPFD